MHRGAKQKKQKKQKKNEKRFGKRGRKENRNEHKEEQKEQNNWLRHTKVTNKVKDRSRSKVWSRLRVGMKKCSSTSRKGERKRRGQGRG